jgi:hypothetical protein
MFFTTDRNGKRTTDPIPGAPEASTVIESFLDRWPILRYPVPPKEGKERPVDYVSFLRKTVEVMKGPPGKKGVHVRVDPRLWRFASSGNVSQGRFLTIRIDLSRSIEEDIIPALKAVVKDYQSVQDWSGFQVNLPAPKAKSSVGKKKELDRWKAYDVFYGDGNCDSRKTAEILFKEHYCYERDHKEAKAKAESEYRAWLKKYGGVKNAPRKGIHAFETKVERILKSSSACTPVRQRERASKEKWILAAVEACKRLISAMSPHKEI